jgi:hypothetical protein
VRTIEGRQWASREDLIEHSGYSRDTLWKLWHARGTNGHPEPRDIDGVMHWDVQVWDDWFTEHCKRHRDLSGVDRSGDPDEPLPPAGQARVLGVDPARITQYTKNPPPEWPEPVHTEQLATRIREYRTRAQLWTWVDDPVSGFGTKGGRPAGPGTKTAAAKTAARIRLAAEALAAMPGRTVAEVAAVLAEQHGQSVDTWKRAITQARK